VDDLGVLAQATEYELTEGTSLIDLITWSELRRPLVRVGIQNTFEGFHYLHEIYSLDHRWKVVMKSAQCRVSEYALNEALWKMTTEGWNVFYAFPTFSKCAQFVQGRFDKAIQCSDWLTAQLRGTYYKTLDNTYIKTLGAGTIYFSGAQNIKQITSADADIIYRDEKNLIPPDVAPAILDRYGNSQHKWLRDISTPEFENVGIHADWLLSDQRKWEVPCPHCGTWQQLTWDRVDMKAHVVRCRNRRCGKALDRLAEGRWVPTKPGAPAAGWHISKLFTPTASIEELVAAYLAATDEFKMQAFYNGSLGEPYSPKGASIGHEILAALVDPEYRMPPTLEDGYTFLGADPGAVIHTRVNKYEKGRVYPVFIGTVPMDERLSHLEPLMQRFRVNQAVIDGQAETSAVKAFCKRHPKRAWANWWKDSMKTALIEPRDKDLVLNSNRTLAFDTWYSTRLEQQQMVLPVDAPVIPGYFDHLKKGRRVKGLNKRGQTVVRWISPKPDHFLLAEVYAELALRMWLDKGYGRRVKQTIRKRAGIVASRTSAGGLP